MAQHVFADGRGRDDFCGLDSLFVELTALMADIKKNPMRYSRVF